MSEKIPDGILEDLKILLEEEEILGKDFDDFIDKLKTDDVKNYLWALKGYSKPEQALKDSFFTSSSLFAEYLFKNLYPEVGGESGFIDYEIKTKGEDVGLEIKPLFEAEFEKGKSGEVFKRIKKIKLSWEKHKEQIRKYLGRKGEFLVFTNLEEWYLFSKNYSLDEKCNYFASTKLFELFEDFERVGDFWQYLDKEEDLSVKELLDKKFFNSLKNWVEELRSVSFNVNEKKKMELIIKLINKFIFIQTLDNFSVIPTKYLQKKWGDFEREWQAKGKLRILKKFLSEINEYFYEFYDTELFRGDEEGKDVLDYIDQDEANIGLFYKKLKLVLGVDFGMTAIAYDRGIIQYNFRRIDEDILGKSYETFLTEIRKERGIYYTPKYITEYIVENTIGKIYGELLDEIKKNLEDEKFDECEELLQKFVSIKVLDPACGSGSFLIKALRSIWKRYEELNKLIAEYDRKYSNFKTLSRSREEEEKWQKIGELKGILNFKNKRDLISKIIIRHIHGNDLDANALEVAKVNLWLESIKLAPTEFKYDHLTGTNHVLPDLKMNLANGDSLVGLPEDETIEFLRMGHKEELKRLFELRRGYLNDPTDEEKIGEINEIKNGLRKELDVIFEKYLEENDLPREILDKTKPFYWALDFWFVYFDENLELKAKEERGFGAVIGNPPYVSSKELPNFYKKHSKISFETAMGQYDIYTLFIEKSFLLLKKGRYFGFIIPDAFLGRSNFEHIRLFLLGRTAIKRIDQISGVFNVPSVSNIVITYQKNFLKDNLILFSRSKSLDTFIAGVKEIEEIPQNYYFTTRKHSFVFLSKSFGDIQEKISKDKEKLGNIIKIHRGEELGKKSKKIIDKELEGSKKILFGKDVKRYEILFSNYFILEKYIKKEKKLYFHPKLVFRQLGEDLNIAYDGKGEFVTLQTIYNVIITNSRYNHYFLIGILNSKLMDFYYKNQFKEKQLFPRILLENIKDLPIIETSKQIQIIQLVSKIIILKKLQHKFRKIWRSHSKKYRTYYLSLGEILSQDKKQIQKGNFEDVWTSEASVYPDKKDELLRKEFKKFRIGGEEDKLKIYGIFNAKEELILEIKVKNKELRDILYLEILELFDSRSRVKTLRDIFSKSMISVIQPNTWEGSINLLKGTMKKFEKWLKEKDFEIKEKETDIVKINEEIQDIDNLIDTHVFKLYDLNREEVETVLESLNTLESVKNDIMKKFEGLGKNGKV